MLPSPASGTASAGDDENLVRTISLSIDIHSVDIVAPTLTVTPLSQSPNGTADKVSKSRFWPPLIFQEATVRLPYYVSDITDAWHRKIVSSALFVLFVSLAPSLTFGDYLVHNTDGQWGVTEVLFSCALCGVIYSLLAAQPITIVGVSGPITILAGTLHTLAKQYDINFIAWFAIANLWTALFHFILAFINAPSLLVSVTTRFAEDTFGMLISVIFIVNCITDLVDYFTSESLGLTLDAQYLCFILTFGTVLTALSLHKARDWRMGNTLVRDVVADYAAVGACVFFSLIAYLPHFADSRRTLPTLELVGIYEPTSHNGRVGTSWFPDFASVPAWAVFSAILPAILITALFWFDHCVSKMSCEAAQFELRKPTQTFNYDFAVLGLTSLVCGMLGLPPVNGIIPQCALHAKSLSIISVQLHTDTTTVTTTNTHTDTSNDSVSRTVRRKYSVSESKVCVRVLEQRVSNFLQSLLTGIILCLPSVLSLIPRAVLSGVFLFMGITGLADNQLYHRLIMLISDSSRAKDPFTLTLQEQNASRSSIVIASIDSVRGKGWREWLHCHSIGRHTRGISVCSVHLFTLLQFACFGAVYGITWTVAGVAFPLLILLLIPLRHYGLTRLFSPGQLAFLDSSAAVPEWTSDSKSDSGSGAVSVDVSMDPLSPAAEGASVARSVHHRQVSHEEQS